MLLALGLLFPIGTASAATLSPAFSARAIQGEGAWVLDGDGVAFVATIDSGGLWAPWVGSMGDGVVIVEEAARQLATPLANFDPEYSRSDHPVGEGDIRIVDRGDTTYVMVTALGGPVAVEGDGARWTLSRASDQARIFPPLIHADAFRPTIPTTYGLEHFVGASTVSIEGSLRISLMGPDVAVGGEIYRTGVIRSPLMGNPAVPPTVVGEEVQRVVHIEADHVSLVLNVPSSGFPGLLAPTAALSAKGWVTVADAQVEVDGVLQADVDVDFADGAVFEALTASGTDVSGTIADGADPTLNGQPATIAGTSQFPAGLVAAGGILLLAVAFVAGWHVRSSPGRQLARLEEAMNAQEYRRVALDAKPYRGRPNQRRRSAVLKAIALLALEEFHEAGLFLASLAGASQPDPATHAFLRAHAAAGSGDMAAAKDLLDAAIRLGPQYAAEASLIPELAPLVTGD